MSKILDWVCQSAGSTNVCARGDAIGVAVAITDTELITGRAGIFSRSSGKMQRFPLAAVANLRHTPNPSASLLQIDFATTPPQTVTFMYEPQAKNDFDRIRDALEQAARRGGLRGCHD